jgi:hypothetical protein
MAIFSTQGRIAYLKLQRAMQTSFVKGQPPPLYFKLLARDKLFLCYTMVKKYFDYPFQSKLLAPDINKSMLLWKRKEMSYWTCTRAWMHLSFALNMKLRLGQKMS